MYLSYLVVDTYILCRSVGMNKKFKAAVISISVVGTLTIIALLIWTIYLFNHASIIEVMSRLG